MINSDSRRGAERYLLRLALILATALAPSYAVTDYTISLVHPEQHLVEVQIQLPEGSSREMQLPVWNALYQVRDFAQYVNWVRAKDRAGRPLTVHALDKSRWQISGAEGAAVVEYEIYVDSFGPFGTNSPLIMPSSIWRRFCCIPWPLEASRWWCVSPSSLRDGTLPRH